MSQKKLPYIKLQDIQEVTDIHRVKELLADDWVYLGFCPRLMTPNLGATPELNYQVPTHYLGLPEEE